MTAEGSLGRRGGRPREFDTEKALDVATDLFWRRGYEGCSIAELTTAMGINRPSLYAAFGDKASLFRKVVERYQAQRNSETASILSHPNARKAIEDLLRRSVDWQTDEEGPRGCLLVQGSLQSAADGPGAVRCLRAQRAATEAALADRLRKAAEEGELSTTADSVAMARYFYTVIEGCAAQARDGASREALHTVVDCAMRAWPEAAGPKGS